MDKDDVILRQIENLRKTTSDHIEDDNDIQRKINEKIENMEHELKEHKRIYGEKLQGIETSINDMVKEIKGYRKETSPMVEQFEKAIAVKGFFGWLSKFITALAGTIVAIWTILRHLK